jgi:hypothetical protein
VTVVLGLFIWGSSRPREGPTFAAGQEPATLWIQKCIQGGSPDSFRFDIYDDQLNVVSSVELQASDFTTPKAGDCAFVAQRSLLLPPGQYYLVETPPPGWQLVNWECSVNSNCRIGRKLGDPQFCGPPLGPGEIVWCTFTNRHHSRGPADYGGRLTIIKRTTGGDGTFGIPWMPMEGEKGGEGGVFSITTANGLGTITPTPDDQICLAAEDQVLKGDCQFVRSECWVEWACDVMAVRGRIPVEKCLDGSPGYVLNTRNFMPPDENCTFRGFQCTYVNECKGGGGGKPALSVTKVCEPRTVAVGMPVTCQITVTNSGNRPEIFQITEHLPAAMEFVSATPPGWASVENGQLIIRGSVPANSSVTITVVVVATGHGRLVNTVQVSNSGGSSPECKAPPCPSDSGPQASAAVTSRGRPNTVGTAFIAASALRTASSSATVPKVPKGVLLVDSETNRLLVYLSRGDGTFRRFKTYATAESPVDVKAGDFDNDGRTDAVVVNSLSDSFTIYLGNGDGTFRKGREFKLFGTKPVAVVLADFDRDSVLDLAIAQQGSADIAILLGRGDGTFRHLATVPLFEGRPSSISIADWNEDGVTDLIVTAIGSNEVVFFRGDGRGHFSEAGRHEVGEYPVASATGDFDGDGQMDIAVANLLSDSITLLLSQGKSRSLGFTRVDVESVERPTFVLSGEFFNGTTGVAAPNFTSNTVTFIRFEGGRPRIVRRVRVIAEPVSLGLGDFNDDGRLDVAVAGLPVGSLATLLGRDNGAFVLKR